MCTCSVGLGFCIVQFFKHSLHFSQSRYCDQEPLSGMSTHWDQEPLSPVENSQVQDSQIQDSQDAMEPCKRPAPVFGPQPAQHTTKLEDQPPAQYSGPCDWKVELPNFITADLKERAEKMLAEPDENHSAPQVTITMPLRTFADNKPKRGRIAYDTDPDKVKEGRPIFIGKQWSHGEYFLAVWTRKFKEGSSASSNGDKVKEGSS